MPDRLAASTSPSLRQHADHPVDWRQRGRGGGRIAEAREREVPISLARGGSHAGAETRPPRSIGIGACDTHRRAARRES